MDYSSDNDSNEELPRDQEIIGPEQFNTAFNNNREINGEDDDIREEENHISEVHTNVIFNIII